MDTCDGIAMLRQHPSPKTTEARVLKTLLLQVRNNKKYRSTNGICHAIIKAEECLLVRLPKNAQTWLCSKYLPDYVVQYARAWPRHSGDNTFPVPSSWSALSAEAAYYRHDYGSAKWSRRTSYGRARWELLNWLIDYYLRRVKPYTLA